MKIFNSKCLAIQLVAFTNLSSSVNKNQKTATTYKCNLEASMNCGNID